MRDPQWKKKQSLGKTETVKNMTRDSETDHCMEKMQILQNFVFHRREKVKEFRNKDEKVDWKCI